MKAAAAADTVVPSGITVTAADKAEKQPVPALEQDGYQVVLDRDGYVVLRRAVSGTSGPRQAAG